MTRTTLRILLLVGAVLAAIAYSGDTIFAQEAAPAADAATALPAEAGKIETVIRLVFGYLDFVTIIIFLLSIVSLTLIIFGAMSARKGAIMPDASVARIRDMISNKQYQELLSFTETDTSFLSKVVNPALKKAPNGYDQMKETMEIAIGEQTADSFRKVEYLNIIGNLGPLLGLLGTVLGMMVAFDQMNRAGGNAAPAQLAIGIATALAHTFLGLFLAIPSLAAYGILRQILDRNTTRASIVAEELLQMMRPAKK